MRVNPKSEKGAITLIVLVSMLFLMALLMSMYIKIANKAKTSAETTKQIQEQYNNIDEAETIYKSYFADSDIIPIYSRDHLEKIGSKEPITIDGKIYTFAPDAYYTIKNDLDLGGNYDTSTNTWEVEEGKEWTPITNEFTGILDGLGHTITGIYLGENEGTQGIFQELNGTVKNIYVKDSYKVTNMNGLLAGTNNGEIINCYYEKVLIGLKVGDYVNYTPTVGTYKVADGANGTGYTTDAGYQTFTTETGDSALKWRILSIDEKKGEIELVSATAGQVDTRLYLQGADGYNHGVDILNDLCGALYSKTVNGKKVAAARSLNLEDINKKTTYDPTTETKYGTEYRFSTKNYATKCRKYPSLYELEDGFYIKGVKQEGGLSQSAGLDDGVTKDGVTTYSTVTGYIDDWDSTTGTMKKDISVTHTYYGYDTETYLNTKLGINTAPQYLFTPSYHSWLATRNVYGGSTGTSFYIYYITASGTIGSPDIFYSSGSAPSQGMRICPVVLLHTTDLLDYSIGDGSAENPWGMK